MLWAVVRNNPRRSGFRSSAIRQFRSILANVAARWDGRTNAAQSRDDDEASSNFFYEAWSSTVYGFGVIFDPFVELTVKGYERLNGEGSAKADRMLVDRTSADNRREGMNQLAENGFLNNPIFRKRCREIAQLDPDPGVRATAIRTCNRAHDAEATGIFVAGLDPKNDPWMRLESAKRVLANLPDARAADELRAIAEDSGGGVANTSRGGGRCVET